MTSQIVLINQSGIAVASDTMVTMTGSNGDRSLPVATKIYELGGKHNVVVLHSGSESIAGISWELLVHEWSLDIATKEPFSSLEEYVSKFQDWVTAYRDLEIDENASAFNVICAGNAMTSTRLSGGLDEKLRRSRSLDALPSELETELVGELRQAAKWLAEGDATVQVPNLSVATARLSVDAVCEEIARHRKKEAEDAIEDPDQGDSLYLCEDFMEHLCAYLKVEVAWGPTPGIEAALRELAAHNLTYEKGDADRPTAPTSLTFVGFGSKESIGGSIELKIKGVYARRMAAVKLSRYPKAGSIPRDAVIVYLARQDAMADFIRGLDENRRDEIVRTAARVLHQLLHEGEEDWLPDEKAQQLYEAFMEAFYGRLGRELNEEFEQPARRTLAALSLPNLVKAAEALISIQSLRARMTDAGGVVGGSVEGLTIGRVTGVQWDQKATIAESGRGFL